MEEYLRLCTGVFYHFVMFPRRLSHKSLVFYFHGFFSRSFKKHLEGNCISSWRITLWVRRKNCWRAFLGDASYWLSWCSLHQWQARKRRRMVNFLLFTTRLNHLWVTHLFWIPCFHGCSGSSGAHTDYGNN